MEDIYPHWHLSRPEPRVVAEPAELYPLPVLDPLIMRGRGRPRGALGGIVRVAPTNTRREPSAFERPSGSAPPIVNQPAERVYIVNSGLARLEGRHEDLYEPGTISSRAYMRGAIEVEAIELD
jgi:hypothetical protein